MIPLKYNTASQEIPLGYFLDDTDGKTAEEGLTIANTDIKLWKNGATTLANKNSGGGTHISGGIYYAVLDATDTGTYGPMKIFVHMAGALPCILECLVMQADAYDALMAAAGTGHIEADMIQISGDATAANNAESFFDGTGYAGTNNVIPTVTTVGTTTTNTDMLTAAAVNAEVDTALADYDGPTNAEMEARTIVSANYFDPAADTVATVTDVTNQITAAANADAVWDEAKAGHVAAGSTGEEIQSHALSTEVDAVPTAVENRTEMDSNSTQLAAIVADTNELQTDDVPGLIGALNDFDPTADDVAIVTDITNEVTADVTKISGDATAADNLELQYDTTGLTGDTFPATQAAVGNLTSGTAAINTTAESFTKNGAEPETNTYTATHQEDGVYHIVEDDAGSTDFYYQFSVGGNGVPVSITWHGYAQSQGDSYTVWAYNYGTTSYEQIGSITALAGTTAITQTYDLTNAHVGTAANLGLVRFRILSADGTAFATDRVLCSYAVVAQSVGYADGAIWVNTNASNTNTETYIDGTADNPVSTWAAALTISGNLGITRFHIINGSTITLTGNSDNYTFKGFEWTLATGGQSLAGAYVEGAIVTGIATGAGARYFYCKIAQGASFTTAAAGFKDCAIAGDIIAGAAGTLLIDACFSGVAGTATPSFDFGAAVGDINLNMRHYSGGIEIKNMGGAGTDKMSLEGDGQLVINVNCSGGVAAIRGHFTVTDNASGAVTLSDDARIDVDQINAEVDTALVDIKLDHLIAVADADDAVNDSIVAKLAASDGDWSGFDNATDSLEAIRDRGDAAWVTGAGGSSPTVIEIRTEMDDNSTKLADIVADTNELQTDDVPGLIGALNDPTAGATADAVLDEALAGHVVAGSLGKAIADTETDVTAILADTDELQGNQADWATAVGFSTHSAANVRTEMDSNSTQFIAIVADTNELQVDWTNGGRLDLILDDILADTNELQTDDVPGLIAALNNLSAADVNAEVDTAFTTQMADSVPADGTIPTREEAIYMITQWLMERAVSGTTVTVKKVDGSTGLMTFTLDDGTSPTSITRAT